VDVHADYTAIPIDCSVKVLSISSGSQARVWDELDEAIILHRNRATEQGWLGADSQSSNSEFSRSSNKAKGIYAQNLLVFSSLLGVSLKHLRDGQTFFPLSFHSMRPFSCDLFTLAE
jgi:hypothetical protein